MRLVRARTPRPIHARPAAAPRLARGGLIVLCLYAGVIGMAEIRLQNHVSATTSVEIAPFPMGEVALLDPHYYR